jgi:two-component system response regulator RegA
MRQTDSCSDIHLSAGPPNRRNNILRSILLADDDRFSRQRLNKGLSDHFHAEIVEAENFYEAINHIKTTRPDAVIAEVKLGSNNGLDLIQPALIANPTARIVFHTSFASVASAVSAIRQGALDYVTKSAGVEDLIRILSEKKGPMPAPPEHPLSADRARWEHIQRIYTLCGYNISETARRLCMHRRTLQRILSKNAPK